MSCECYRIGGPFITYDPDCEVHRPGGAWSRIEALENGIRQHLCTCTTSQSDPDCIGCKIIDESYL